MALFWRIWAAVTLVILVVLTIFVGLATVQFANINADLIGGRLSVLAERTAAPFEAAAKIGLSLSTVRNAGALLERARQTDDAIRAIHVFEADGRIVHSTETPAPAAIPPEAAGARTALPGVPRHIEISQGFISIIEVPGRGNEVAGGILIVYPATGNLTQVRAMGAELAIAAIVVLIFSAAISGLLLRLGLSQPIRTFEAIDQSIINFERGAWRSAAAAQIMTEKESGELRSLLNSAETRYRATGAALAELQRDES